MFKQALLTHRKAIAFGGVTSLVASSSAYYYFFGDESSQKLQKREKFIFAENLDTTKCALNPNEFVPFKLQDVEKVTHNVKRYRFALPEKDMILGTSVCSCILTKADIHGKEIIRPYTPISTPHERGHFDLLIKIYEQGNMSKHIDDLKIGDVLFVKGPIPKYKYEANNKERIGMIAGGTGITPMYQLIREVLDNPNDKTELYLLYANQTPNDIMMKNEFDKLAAKHKNFHVLYTVDKVGAEENMWKGEKGYINERMILTFFDGFDPSDYKKNVVMVCGPPPMMKSLSGEKLNPRDQGPLTGILKRMGYSEENVYKF